MRFSAAIGCFVLVTVLASAVLLGSSAGAFVNAPALVFVLMGTLALSLVSFGARDLALGLYALRVLVIDVAPPNLSDRDAAVLRGTVVHAYAWAAVLTLVGAVQMLRNVGDTHSLGTGIAVMLLVPLYALLGTECMLRPALHQVRLKLAATAEGDPKGVPGE